MTSEKPQKDEYIMTITDHLKQIVTANNPRFIKSSQMVQGTKFINDMQKAGLIHSNESVTVESTEGGIERLRLYALITPFHSK